MTRRQLDTVLPTYKTEETAINIGVATGLLAAEKGKLERPM